MFKQKIEDGFQVEMPDNWLKDGNPFELRRPEYAKEVRRYKEILLFQTKLFSCIMVVIRIKDLNDRLCNWLKDGNPFELRRPEYAKEVRFGGNIRVEYDDVTGEMRFVQENYESVMAPRPPFPRAGSGS